MAIHTIQYVEIYNHKIVEQLCIITHIKVNKYWNAYMNPHTYTIYKNHTLSLSCVNMFSTLAITRLEYCQYDVKQQTISQSRQNKEYVRSSYVLFLQLSNFHVLCTCTCNFHTDIWSGICFSHVYNRPLDNIFLPSLWWYNFLKLRYSIIHIII